MQTLVNEILCLDSRMCYMKIKEEINFIQEQHFKESKEEELSEEKSDNVWPVETMEEEKKSEEPRPPKLLSLPQEQVQKLRLQLPPMRPPAP